MRSASCAVHLHHSFSRLFGRIDEKPINNGAGNERQRTYRWSRLCPAHHSRPRGCHPKCNKAARLAGIGRASSR